MAPGEVPAVFPDKRPLSGHLIHPKIHTISYFQALHNVQNSSINVLLVFSTASLVLSEYLCQTFESSCRKFTNETF